MLSRPPARAAVCIHYIHLLGAGSAKSTDRAPARRASDCGQQFSSAQVAFSLWSLAVAFQSIISSVSRRVETGVDMSVLQPLKYRSITWPDCAPDTSQQTEPIMKTLCNMKSLSASGTVRAGLSMLLGSSIVVLTACASVPPPTEQMAVSTAAVAHASTAGGGEAAPADMQMARQKLDRARLAMQAENYDLARVLSEEAQVDAQLAEAKAGSIKARKAASELSEGVRVLREELDRKTK